MSDFTMKLGNFQAVPEIGGDNFATSIYERDYDGLLIARCNQNGRYPEHARAIIEGLNGKKHALDEITKLNSEIERLRSEHYAWRASAIEQQRQLKLAISERQRTADLIEEVKRVLEPFAAFSNLAEGFVQARAEQGGSPILPTKHFSVADFRAARALLSKLGER